MNNCKIEIKITGQLIGPGYVVFIEGHQILLQENSPHVYTRTIDPCPVDEKLDVKIILRGWYGTPWSVEVKVNNNVWLSDKGVFPRKGIVSIPQQPELV